MRWHTKRHLRVWIFVSARFMYLHISCTCNTMYITHGSSMERIFCWQLAEWESRIVLTPERTKTNKPLSWFKHCFVHSLSWRETSRVSANDTDTAALTPIQLTWSQKWVKPAEENTSKWTWRRAGRGRRKKETRRQREETLGLLSSLQWRPFNGGIWPSLIIHTVPSSSVQFTAGGQSWELRVTPTLAATEKRMTSSLPHCG